MDISGVITSLSEAIKLIKSIKDTGSNLDNTELKLRLVDLTDKLLESKDALQAAGNRESELLGQINDLRAKLAEKSKLTSENGILYELDDKGERVGEPRCHRCYVKEEKLYPLIYSDEPGRTLRRCSNCNIQLDIRRKPIQGTPSIVNPYSDK